MKKIEAILSEFHTWTLAGSMIALQATMHWWASEDVFIIASSPGNFTLYTLFQCVLTIVSWLLIAEARRARDNRHIEEMLQQRMDLVSSVEETQKIPPCVWGPPTTSSDEEEW